MPAPTDSDSDNAAPGRRRMPGLNRRIAAAFRPYWCQVAIIGLLIAVTAGLGVVNPLLIQTMFDSALFVAGGPDLPLVWTLAGVMAAVVVVTGGLGVAQTWLTQQVGQRPTQRASRRNPAPRWATGSARGTSRPGRAGRGRR